MPAPHPPPQAAAGSSARIETGLQAGPVAQGDLPWPDDCGGEACFVGRTRGEDHPEYGPLVRLEYEAYAPMAERVLRDMAETAARRFGLGAVRMIHSIGAVDPGEGSVIIQVAAPHRAEAFDGCRYLIDTLKRALPVWKREIWQRGETFVEGCPAHPEDRGERDA